MGAGLKHGQQFHISFWFLLSASMARKECSQQHFLNVRLFSKVQIWYPSPLGWDRVNCLAKKMSAGLKPGQQFHISFWFLLLVSMARKEMQPTAFFECAFIFKASNLVEIGLTFWQKNGGRTKAWSTISYIFLISIFILNGKKGMQPTTFFKFAFIFKSSNLVSKPPWLR